MVTRVSRCDTVTVFIGEQDCWTTISVWQIQTSLRLNNNLNWTSYDFIWRLHNEVQHETQWLNDSLLTELVECWMWRFATGEHSSRSIVYWWLPSFLSLAYQWSINFTDKTMITGSTSETLNKLVKLSSNFDQSSHFKQLRHNHYALPK